MRALYSIQRRGKGCYFVYSKGCQLSYAHTHTGYICSYVCIKNRQWRDRLSEANFDRTHILSDWLLTEWKYSLYFPLYLFIFISSLSWRYKTHDKVYYQLYDRKISIVLRQNYKLYRTVLWTQNGKSANPHTQKKNGYRNCGNWRWILDIHHKTVAEKCEVCGVAIILWLKKHLIL